MELLNQKHWKSGLLLGFIGMTLCGAGDVLLSWFDKDGTAFFGGMANSEMIDTPLWHFELSMLFGMIAAPLMWRAGSAGYSYISERLQGKKSKMLSLYTIGTKILVLTVFCAHTVCCVAMMLGRKLLEFGLSAEVIESSFYDVLLLPFFLTNIWIIVGELLVSIAYIYMVGKKIIDLPKICLLLNPACLFLLVAEWAGPALTALTNNPIFDIVTSGGGSWGLGLMYLALLAACGRKSAEIPPSQE